MNLIRSYTSNIRKKEFPETITKISGEYFYYDNLESLKLPNKLKEIGEYAFHNYRALKSINIPASVNTIASNAFVECDNLTIIYISKPKETIQNGPWGAVNAKIVWDCGKKYMTIAEKKEWDKTAVPENMFYWKSDNPNNIDYHTIIGYKKDIENYTILRYPTRCQAIEENLEYESRVLNENNQETIRAFTENIKKIEYPDTIIAMATAKTYMTGFRNNKIESIRLPKNLKLLDNKFFWEYYNLKNIYIYKDIEYIGNEALCSSITTIRMQGKAGSIMGAPWGARHATVNWNCDSEQ